ncbi:hypothetical protein J2S43_003204 [Catenuloplanes nepalensis]|uniref:Uncharacterized protein n=1 Tax=Catenuloplanes nepalensis TaxID=587533 RepID=A0ABT9MTC5_9ACTN|nr:hypothetical protein [Catenuloplanes nepalensis]
MMARRRNVTARRGSVVTAGSARRWGAGRGWCGSGPRRRPAAGSRSAAGERTRWCVPGKGFWVMKGGGWCGWRVR